MSNRIAVVTGATGSLGTSMCKALINQRRTVIGSHLPDEKSTDDALSWKDMMRRDGFDVAIYPLDVTDYENCKSFIAQIEEDQGPVEILVNNAGITNDAPLKKMQPEQWGEVSTECRDKPLGLTRTHQARRCSVGRRRPSIRSWASCCSWAIHPCAPDTLAGERDGACAQENKHSYEHCEQHSAGCVRH